MLMNFPGTVMVVVMIAAYASIFILSLIVLWRLVILLPLLTVLAASAHRYLKALDSGDRSPERRLLNIEDLLRLNKITPEEYEAKRKDILNDL